MAICALTGHTIERIYSNISSTVPAKKRGAIALAIEEGENTTTSRVASAGLNVSGNLIVEASSHKLGVNVKRLYALPVESVGLNATAGVGAALGNVVDKVKANLFPFGSVGSAAIVKKYKSNQAQGKKGGLTNWIGEKIVKTPVTPSFQISGAIAIMHDTDTVHANLGFADGMTNSELTVAGSYNGRVHRRRAPQAGSTSDCAK